ncbi:hypothetical protein SUGI_0133640 [Cryptomeria japonica]|uniref:disease resistance protein RPV1-like n=1 Tax=Cryptomeria japonica TaxID=3369 RepID=UPI002408CF94|nr:disease resistance protein RPV1-like [Cryptomeria japonica]GLJ10715.1 hypothetical protein SUGI_0133640 [Cryptomeria japonica]
MVVRLFQHGFYRRGFSAFLSNTSRAVRITFFRHLFARLLTDSFVFSAFGFGALVVCSRIKSMGTTSPSPTQIANTFEEVVPSSVSAVSSSASPLPSASYHVFINHRGADVKYTLATNIRNKLTNLGLSVFLDVHSLRVGDVITAQIEEAIRTASLHIAIFSICYAESPWCLAELSSMLKMGNKIIPLFLHVDPSDLRWVREGKGIYAPAFSQYQEKGRYSPRKLDEWMTALEFVSGLSGCVIKDNEDEGMLLKNIVNMVIKALDKVPVLVADKTFGLDEIVRDYERRVDSENNVQIVGIVGMGGAGKTTLAKELYNRKSSSFQFSSILFSVRDAASRNSLHKKQEKLLKDLGAQGDNLSFDDIEEGKSILANRLRSVRALIVLDDVDHKRQLDALLPTKDCLASGSLVIVTTRELDLLAKWSSTIYEMKPLNPLLAKQLFCWHAFLQLHPEEGFEDIVGKYLKTCNGLPLSLEVLGGLVYGRSKDYWQSRLHKILRMLPEDIKGRLNVSYDALDDEEKEMFMDVACFFVGRSKRLAIEVWDGSGLSGLQGWETLVNKCLVNVDRYDRITMHDHLRDLGRDLAGGHTPPRVWLPGQISNIQKQARGEMSIRGIDGAGFEYAEKLFHDQLRGLGRDLAGGHTPSRVWLPEKISNIQKQARGEMSIRGIDAADKLLHHRHPLKKFTELAAGTLNRYFGHPVASSFGVKRLHHRHPLKKFTELAARTLNRYFGHPVASSFGLKLFTGREEYFIKYLSATLEDPVWLWLDNFMGKKLRSWSLRRLRILEFTNAHYLTGLWGSSDPPLQLRLLHIGDAYMMQRIPKSLGRLTNLKMIALKKCTAVVNLPEEFCDLRSLETLHLLECSMLSSLPSRMGDLINLRNVDLTNCEQLQILPDSFNQLRHLHYLSLCGCKELTLRSDVLENISKLEYLNFDGCKKLEQLPNKITDQVFLRELRVVHTALTELPSDFGKLRKLQVLNIGSPILATLPSSLGNLSSLATLYICCPGLKELPNCAGLHSIKRVSLIHCNKVVKIEGLEHSRSLESLQTMASWRSPVIQSLEGIENLKCLVMSAECRSALQPCIQTLKKWPFEMVICGRAAHGAESVMDSLSFPTLTMVSSLEMIEENEWRIECGKTHTSNAAVLCFLVNSFTGSRFNILCSGGTAFARLGTELEEGKWVCVGVFRQGCRLIDLGYKLTATAGLYSGEGEASRGLLAVGEEAAFTNLWALFM